MEKGIRKSFGYRHIVLLMLWLIYIINYFDRISVLTFLPFIREDLSLTHQQVGFAASIFFFAYALAQVSAGYLADRIGSKKVMGIAVTVFTGVTFLTGLVQNYTQFLLLRLGLGLGEGHHFSPANRTIADWFPKSEKGRATAFFSSTWAVAPAIIPIIITSIAAATGGDWRFCFFLLAIPGILAIWFLVRFVSDKPEYMLAKGRLSREEYDYIKAGLVEESDTGATPKVNTKVVLRDANLWIYTVQLFMTLAVYWGSTTWITSFLYEQHGFDLKTMGFMASLPYIVAFFSTMLGGWLLDKVFHRIKPVSLISYLVAIPVLYYIGQVGKGDTTTLIIMLMLNGFFVNLVWGVIYAYPQIRYPKHVVGTAVGFSNGVGQLGAFLSPLLAGYMIYTTENGQISYDNVFIMFAACCAIAALAAALLNEKTYTAPETAIIPVTENVAQS